MSKFLHQGLLPLNPCVGEPTNLVTVESWPALPDQSSMKGADMAGMDKIDKGITDVTLVLEIHAKVDEIVGISVRFIDQIDEHLLGVLVWNITDHAGGSAILDNTVNVNLVGCSCMIVLWRGLLGWGW